MALRQLLDQKNNNKHTKLMLFHKKHAGFPKNISVGGQTILKVTVCCSSMTLDTLVRAVCHNIILLTTSKYLCWSLCQLTLSTSIKKKEISP